MGCRHEITPVKSFVALIMKEFAVKTRVWCSELLSLNLRKGSCGNGKSSARNTILKQRVFKSKASPESVTAECVSGDRKIDGKKIDTPGLFDTGLDEETIKSKIIRSVIDSSPGPDMFTIVLKFGRYTGQEIVIVEKILSIIQWFYSLTVNS
ncbi:GTPase IMAP family member 7 [Anabarilius grahami]|uniref:GTPase IMAP family member 7 n=1 Tax=Anabarilius grahami TaxID=495550 RepID=A0A3N0Y2U7_ANAGA|nr:GTPase IMAP family member 7 [Anabarilius grahami]